MRSAAWIAIGNHLWQSTLFALCIVLLMLFLRRNSANVRCSLWLVASLKFLAPFTLLMTLGARIPWPSGVGNSTVSAPGVLSFVSDLTAPVAQFTHNGALGRAQLNAEGTSLDTVLLIVLAVWTVGTLALVIRWLLAWMNLRRVLRASQPTGVGFVIPVRSSASGIEPGVVGILNPILLLPEGLEERLTPAQMRAVLAHERCHVARRDNLAAAFHMLVEAVFWFHPLVWWLGARLLEERERACDEYVLESGHAPGTYAEGILKVCQHYVESRLPCVAGVGGANLKKRIEAIMKQPLIAELSGARKVALAAVAGAAVVGPLLVGSLTSSPVRAATPADAATDEFRNVSIERSAQPVGSPVRVAMGLDGKYWHIENMPIFNLIAMAYDVTEQQIIAPDWVKQTAYNVTAETAAAPSILPFQSDSTRALMRKLLADRFGVVVQRERKTMDGYVLMIDSSGSKLTTHGASPEHLINVTVNSLEGTGIEIESLAKALSNRLGAPVVNETGAAGRYDYKLVWGPESAVELSHKGPSHFAIEPADLIKALKDQLGLHLEARPVMVDVINVVGARKPEDVVTKQVAAK